MNAMEYYNVWFKNGKIYRKVNIDPLSESQAHKLAARLNKTRQEDWYQYIVRLDTKLVNAQYN